MSEILSPEALLGALLELSLSLKLAGNQFKEDVDQRLNNTTSVIFAYYRFVSRVFPNSPEYCLPINEILYALKDIQSGRKPPLFEKGKSKKGVATKENVFRSDAAVLMELYQEAGSDRKKAAREVAMRLNALGYRNNSQKISAGNVEDWRDRLKAGSEDEKSRYLWVLNELSEGFPGEPLKAADFFIRTFSDVHSIDS